MARFSYKFTSGDDLIPSFLIRDCRLVFAKPLPILFNLAIKTYTFRVSAKVYVFLLSSEMVISHALEVKDQYVFCLILLKIAKRFITE